VANPLPAVRPLFPHAQARRRFLRQLLPIDRLLHRDHVGDDNVVAIHRAFEIAQRELAQFQIFD
jgi:hypothetical protein